jgi:hypothetical protein
VEEITLGHFDVAGAETLKHKGLQDVVFLLLDYKHLKYWSGFDIMLRHKPMVEQFVEEFYSDTKNISKNRRNNCRYNICGKRWPHDDTPGGNGHVSVGMYWINRGRPNVKREAVRSKPN